LLALKIAVAALALTASSLWAQDGLPGALSRSNLASSANLLTPFGQTLAFADFDGDHNPDGAVLLDRDGRQPQSSFRTIELHFTGRLNIDLALESSETALAISALDVNRDGAADIVVEQSFTHKRIQVWLNDGRGGFRKVRSEDFPSADAGNCERLESPSQPTDFPAIGLSPQRASDLAISTPCTLASGCSSAREQAPPSELIVGSRAAAPSSSRSPPLC
jgi:hypothetical protein